MREKKVGNPFSKVGNLVISDSGSDDEVEDVYDETSHFMTSGGVYDASLYGDKDSFGTFLRSHLSPKSYLYDQILPQIASLCILGTWDRKSEKWHFLEEFRRKREENDEVTKFCQQRESARRHMQQLNAVTSYLS